MKYTKNAVFSAAAVLVASLSVSAIPVRRDVDPSLIPEFGLASGINPTGTGNCDGIPGANGQPIEIPCDCPPDRDLFIQDLNANVAAGHVVNNSGISVSFPTDGSQASQLARIQTAIVTLQNLRGPGVGCPAASTTFLAQQKAVQDGTATTAVTSPPPATTTAAAASSDPPPSSSSGGVDPSLVPEFGLAAGINPTGTGDCDGIPGANGQPIKIPCACPPDRNLFIADLSANVAAGHAINNSGVAVTFPTDGSQASQLARIEAAIVTLQNLRGPGVGCPAASTTFVAQQQAIQDGTAATAASSPPPATTTAAAAAAPNPPPASSSGGVDPSLVPEFGLAAGINPTGTGDCDGIAGANGQPIKIPCACPPDRDLFIQDLSANVAAGHAVNNPSVAVSFPTDGSSASQAARIEAAIVTLQNLNGPGQGCPAASTTFSAQLKAAQSS